MVEGKAAGRPRAMTGLTLEDGGQVDRSTRSDTLSIVLFYSEGSGWSATMARERETKGGGERRGAEASRGRQGEAREERRQETLTPRFS